MKYRVVTSPDPSPLYLDLLKAQLGVTLDLDDALLARKIRAACDYVEGFVGQVLVAKTFDGFLPRFPPREIRLPIGPLRSVEAVAWRDAQGVEQTLDPAHYLVDDVNDPGQILTAPGRAWPEVGTVPNAVRVRFIAGLRGEDEDEGEIPEGLVEAILQLASWWYEQRETAIVEGSAREIPFGVAELLRSHRGWTFG